MADPYTMTTADIRARFVAWGGTAKAMYEADFDRWLAEHDREVRRAEATAIANDMDGRAQAAMFSFIARDRATSDDAGGA